jgi:GNAT superfamily N-acetyltransferase
MGAPVAVTTWYLEMRDPGALKPARAPSVAPAIRRIVPPQPELNRQLYVDVGRDWYWRDRLAWDAARWAAFVNRPGVETWVMEVDGANAGYVELDRQAEGNVEIAYFGITPAHFGRGLGGYLLTEAIRRAWDGGTRRVWVHTCSLDHRAALPNYQARGMRIYKEETVLKELPPPVTG